ncbi:hypothetical protein VNO80_30365 [Phaseolus coccineus]|uniref:Uncharacterized protein n=1 Tax=Phaseolus coccineus TaxID=3886 RepID=A0AAN9QDD9_PHACN
MAVHQFAQCITCHAWSADQSSNYPLFSLSIFRFFFPVWIPTKFTVSRENRVRHSLSLLPILVNPIPRWFKFWICSVRRWNVEFFDSVDAILIGSYFLFSFELFLFEIWRWLWLVETGNGKPSAQTLFDYEAYNIYVSSVDVFFT